MTSGETNLSSAYLKLLRYKVNVLAWNLEFTDFVTKVLEKEPNLSDPTQLDAYTDFLELAKILSKTNNKTIDKLTALMRTIK